MTVATAPLAVPAGAYTGFRLADLWPLHGVRLFHAGVRRDPGRPDPRAAANGGAGRASAGARPPADGVRGLVRAGAGDPGAGGRVPERQHLHPGGTPLPQGRSTPQPRLHPVQRRHQHRSVRSAAGVRHPGRGLRLVSLVGALATWAAIKPLNRVLASACEAEPGTGMAAPLPERV